jgi:arabinan endo-1,5-alpha-L-arabinosidase
MSDRFIAWLLVAVTHGLASCSSIPQASPGTQAETYRNPVIATDFPDPAVLRALDGWFYAYATQTSARGKMLNVQVARSRNLVHWEHLGDALPRKPLWSARKQMFWAPHVIFDRALERYFMYYSAEPDDAEGKCLAVATSDAPAGPFIDAGNPMLCGVGFEHIDPMAFDDPNTGKHLLYWGSDSKPIRVQELAPDRLRFLPGSQPTDLIFPDRQQAHHALIEGAWVNYRDGTYYLFYSGDRCCGPRARYAVMVARARNALGPFERYDGDEGAGDDTILRYNGFWRAPGHNSIVRDAEGNDWILYHAIDAARAYFEDLPRRRASQRVMLLDRIIYRNGWPRIAGDQPSTGPQKAPILPLP